MNIKKEQVIILTGQEVALENANKVLNSVKKVETMIERIGRIGNRTKGGWKGENGELCYERIQEINQEMSKVLKQIREYAKEIQSCVQKEQTEIVEQLPDLPGDFLD